MVQAETEQYTWYRAETEKTKNEAMKDEFYAFYLTVKKPDDER